MFRLTRLTFCCDGCSVTEDVTSLKVIIILHGIFFFLLLFHRLADDEALIILQQTSLFLVLPYAVDNCMPLSSKSFLTLSIHLFLGLPLLLSPLTCQCSAALGSLSPSILSTCPNHLSLLLLIFSITVSSAPSSSLVFSFRILSLLPLILLNHAISATSSLLLSSFLSVQHSYPCINTGSTRAQCSFILVLSDMLFVRMLSSFPKAAHASPVILLVGIRAFFHPLLMFLQDIRIFY